MHTTRRIHRRGLSRSDVIIIIVAVAVIGIIGCLGAGLVAGVMLPSLGKARGMAKLLKDTAQVRQIQSTMAMYAADNEGAYPLPSAAVAALPAPGTSPATPDRTLDHSAHIYSILVMLNYVPPELLVGTTEVNDLIRPKDDYDYEAYDVTARVLWDDTFVMRLDDPAVGANGSYAHLAPVGDRRDRWRSTADAATPVLGTRGVRGGVTSGPDHDRSPAIRLHGPPRQWQGNMAFGDGHTEMLTTFTPPNVTFTDPATGRAVADNLFAAEFPHALGNEAAGDAFLVICTAAEAGSVVEVFDLLR